MDREQRRIVPALRVYEVLIIGSLHPAHVLTDPKTLRHCFTEKTNTVHESIEAKCIFLNFKNSKSVHTLGQNRSVFDMLSRSFTKADLQLIQLKHKQLRKNIDFAFLQNF